MQMKKRGLIIAGIIMGALLPGVPRSAGADVTINVDLGVPPPPVVVAPPPPRVVVAAPPEVVLIPGTRVYFAPDAGIDIFFYSGRWYRKHHGTWYRAAYYNGPWVYLPPRKVPAAFVHLPGDCRVYSGYRRISYGQLKKKWKEEEKERRKHWEKHHKHHKHHEGKDD
ncbi:MAG: hypothetical protein K8I29_09565 [Alphaproteobacteria bacterium]|uniref:YXWGXW repeat-containing protein n=1 Tax=Candidatus Nitrobium versatile TaxID=2884831 RepID=A0A953M054_9BACT|nr:hypothetical protein [Candidatus Nitrobium versatile]